MLAFRTIIDEDKDILDEYLYKYGENSCQHSFVMMQVMNEKYGDEMCILDDCLYILRHKLCTENKRVYLFPFCCNEKIEKALQLIMLDASEHGACVEFFTVTENEKTIINNIYKERFIYQEDRDYAEYLYKSDELKNLTGRKFASKRNHVRNFLSNYGEWMNTEHFGFEAGDSDDDAEKRVIDDILSFQDRYLIDKEKSPLYLDFVREDKRIRETLLKYKEMGIRGVGLYVDSELIGYAYGAPLSNDCIDEIAEKGDISYPSVYQMVNKIFAEMVSRDFKYINREEDLGLEGLRKAKLSLNPYMIMNKFIVTEVV